MAPDGALWFGIYEGGISRLDGESASDENASDEAWTTYTTDDGLVDNRVWSIAVTPDGTVWVGTRGGVSRFDGEGWTTYTEDDGLASNEVTSIAVAPNGALWFGTGRGVSRFTGSTSDDEAWTTYTMADVLVHNWIQAIVVAPDGAPWVGTTHGVSRFSGESASDEGASDEGASDEAWTTFTEDDGLAHNNVWSIAVAPDGALWFGTQSYGVSRYMPPD